ncbi:MAG: glycosyltransferase family 4 protein [Proteobacteria bacterium]|nr:glycosyltransferase family 4 protein [Pseudomonadota bacterium]MBS0574483.1 glycosyltransferase family 4 protein [Pseudomonadota bacterium]
MIHVGIDASAWDNERGFGRFTRSLVGALAARGGDFRYTLLFATPPERPVPDGVAVAVAGAARTMAAAASGAGARGGADMRAQSRAAARLGADVFFFPAHYSFFPILSRVPKVVCIHDTIPERFPDLVFPTRRNFRFWQAKTWLAKWQATRVMTVSDASAADIAAMLNVARRRIDVVTEGAEEGFRPLPAARAAAARARHAIPEGAPLLAYVGGFNRHKNVLRLIEAMPAILAACPEARLAIVGRTTGERFWDNIDELKAGASRDVRTSDRIVFTGEIPDAEMAELLNASSALVMPSLWEGFGLPALESMSCGVPVLAANRGSLPEVVGDAGLYFEPEDRAELAAAAVRLLTEPGLQADLAGRALRRAGLFGWDRAAALAERSFRRAAGG